MLVDRRDELTRTRVQTVNRLHRLLSELTPGKAKKDLTALQAKRILAGVRPRDLAGKTRRRLAAEQLTELVAVEKKMKNLTAELKAMVLARGSTLMDLTGVGPVVAARILADVGDVARFADRNRFASWTGTAPLDASSGEQIRHRLSRAGNRKMNHVLHIAAACQARLDTPFRGYYRRKLAQGKTRPEAMRCLKRRISDAVYRQLLADAKRAAITAAAEPEGAGPGGHCGASLISSAADSHPLIDTSDQPLPGPATTTLRGASPRTRKTHTTDPSTPPVDNRGEPQKDATGDRAMCEPIRRRRAAADGWRCLSADGSLPRQRVDLAQSGAFANADLKRPIAAERLGLVPHAGAAGSWPDRRAVQIESRHVALGSTPHRRRSRPSCG